MDGIRKALVLQGGGALGAFALGALRVLYREHGFRPDLISGVSIGAITAALLARPKDGDPLGTLEAFWKAVTVDAPFWPEAFQRYASAFGNPHFFTPRTDVWAAIGWTNLYSTAPLKRTLARFVDEDALADRAARPVIVLTATDVVEGQIEPFDSSVDALTLDHILASGSLPPSFPMTTIGERAYWDGGVFDNTPLGEVLGKLDRDDEGADERQVVVINLFPNKGAVPTDLSEVSQRMLDLMFANKTQGDLKLLDKFNGVAALLKLIREHPDLGALREHPAFVAANKDYVHVPKVLEISREGATPGGAWSDFSATGIRELAEAGERAAWAELAAPKIANGQMRRPALDGAGQAAKPRG